MKINRRTFLKQAVCATAVAGFSARSWSQVAGANDAVRVAVVGFHGRGKNHISQYLDMQKGGKVRLTALCDVDSKVLDAGVASCKTQGTSVEAYRDIRKLLESKNVDAISIAMPNHWHALGAIWGMEAGKDVYVEKPVSHGIPEGGKMIATARKLKRIVQAGLQSRSSQGIRQAVEWVQSGKLGKIQYARGLCYKLRPSIGKTTGPQPIPESVDYDLWCGPAPMTPPRRNSPKNGTVHYDWHWFWDYGDGDIANQGVHQMDIARWFLGEPHVSPRVLAVGGRLGYDDDGETPNTMIALHDYRNAPLIFEVRGLPEKTGAARMDTFQGAEIGVLVQCEGGHVLVPDYSQVKAYDKDGKEIQSWEGATSHFENFINAVRSRNVSDLNCDIAEGHISSALCHSANISYRVGARKRPSEIHEQIKGEKELVPTFERMAEHLAANGVDLLATPLTLGMVLRMNPGNEKFIQNKEANMMLTRKYRAPFVI